MSITIEGLGQRGPRERSLPRHRRFPARPPVRAPARAEADDAAEGAPRPTQAELLRAQVAALDRAIQASEHAVAVVSTARGGLESIAQRLASLQRSLRHAARGWPEAQYAAERVQQRQQGLETQLATIERIVDETRFGPQRLLDGSLGCTAVASGDGLDFVTAGDGVHSSPPQGFAVRITQEPTRATALGAVPLPEDAAVELVVEADGRRASHTTAPGETPAEAAAALAAEGRAQQLPVSVSATDSGRLLVQHECHGAAYRFAVRSSAPGVLSDEAGCARLVANGRDVAGTLNGEPADGVGALLTGRADNDTTAGLCVRYTGTPALGPPGARTRLPNGGLLAGHVIVAHQALTLSLGEGQAPEVWLRLDAMRPGALGRGVPNASGMQSLADIRAGTAAEAADALRVVDAAAEQVADARHRAAVLASEQLPPIMARLRVKAENLTAADGGTPAAHAEELAQLQELSRHVRHHLGLDGGVAARQVQYRPSAGSLLTLLEGDGR